MAKYSFEFKLKLVHDYLSGQGGLRFLAKKYGFKNSSQINKWINAYKELGEEGLLRSRKSKNYSVQITLDAIELSCQKVANLLKMNNPSLIANWLRMYRKFGIEGDSLNRKDVHLPCLGRNEMNPNHY